MNDEELKQYYCSVHGPDGDPTCKECWTNLHKLLSASNAHVVTDKVSRKCIEK